MQLLAVLLAAAWAAQVSFSETVREIGVGSSGRTRKLAAEKHPSGRGYTSEWESDDDRLVEKSKSRSTTPKSERSEFLSPTEAKYAARREPRPGAGDKAGRQSSRRSAERQSDSSDSANEFDEPTRHRSSAQKRSSSRRPALQEPAQGTTEKVLTAFGAILTAYDKPGSPIVNVIIAMSELFRRLVHHGVKNEFFSTEEFAYYNRHEGAIEAYLDDAAMMMRIARPVGCLLVHMLAFYDFPFSPGLWGLMIIVDILVVIAWRSYDPKWMIAELGHWDYLFGVMLFLAAGAVSLVHQGINFLTHMFFLMAPFLLLLGYAGILGYAAIKKPHQYF